MRAGQWALARARFQSLKARHPDYQRQSLDQFIATAEREILNGERLEAARRQLDAGNLAEAATALGALSATTLQYKELDRVRASLNQRVDEVRGRVRQGLGQSPNDDERRRLANLARDALAARPTDRDLAGLLEQLEAPR